MTYDYLVEATGQIITVEQSIKDDAHSVLEIDGELFTVRRLISAESGGFRLVSGASGGWASTGYSKPENHRRAEAMLGRSLRKPAS